MADTYHALVTLWRLHAAAAAALARMGLEVVNRLAPPGDPRAGRPELGSYLIVSAWGEPRLWHAVSETAGVLRVVGGAEPAAIRRAEVERYLARGAVELPPEATPPPAGARVAFSWGAFHRCEGAATGDAVLDRVGVEIALLGRRTVLYAPVHLVRVIDGASDGGIRGRDVISRAAPAGAPGIGGQPSASAEGVTRWKRRGRRAGLNRNRGALVGRS